MRHGPQGCGAHSTLIPSRGFMRACRNHEMAASLASELRHRIPACYPGIQPCHEIGGLRTQVNARSGLTITTPHNVRSRKSHATSEPPATPRRTSAPRLARKLRDLRIEAGFTLRTRGEGNRVAPRDHQPMGDRDTLPGDTAFADLLDSCDVTSRERKTLTRAPARPPSHVESSGGVNCVEAGDVPGAILIRDTTQQARPGPPRFRANVAALSRLRSGLRKHPASHGPCAAMI